MFHNIHRKATTALLLMALAPNAFANDQNMKALFDQINRTSKGALGPNTYQGRESRQNVEVNGVVVGAPRGTIFTAAFPSDLATRLAAEEGLLVGHHFTTDYFKLHKKFVAAANEPATGLYLDTAAFQKNSAILPEMKNMVLQMILEKFYIGLVPTSRVAAGNLFRGTADADNEKTFYGYFASYLAGHIDANNANDYLTLFEMQRRFNLTGDANQISLESLRAKVASLYDQVAKGGVSTAESAFKQIRNSIHNYMTPDVIGRLDKYLATYAGNLDKASVDGIKSLKSSIETYYKVDKNVLIQFAMKIPATQLPSNFAEVMTGLKNSGNDATELSRLSQLMVSSVDQFKAGARNPDIIHWIIKAQAFLQNELARQKMDESNWQLRAGIALDSVYSSGLLSKEKLSSLRSILSKPINLADKNASSSVQAQLNAVLTEALQRAKSTYQPAVAKWSVVYEKTEGVVDDTLRSSQLTELDPIISMLGSRGGAIAGKEQVLLEGSRYGYLVFVPKGATNDQIARLDKRAIAIFAENPLYLGVVKATISEQPQTPLSHIKIKSDSRGTPNAYYANAHLDPKFANLLNSKEPVYVQFTSNGIQIRKATLAEAEAAWSKEEAPKHIDVVADLSETRIRSTDEMNSKDFMTVGSKTANYAEASHILPKAVLKGWGIPFSYYKEFMDQNKYDANLTLSQYVQSLVQDPRMNSDKNFQVEALTKLREKMNDPSMKVNPKLVETLKAQAAATYPGRSIRLRSSTNSEDLPNFSGAGLYDSYSYNPKKPEKSMEAALRATWASVWNQRAYEERENSGIPHLKVYMAILVSPGFKDELANGVAVTRNIKQSQVPGAGVYINTQMGEEAVTNPDPTKNLRSEELVITAGSKDLHYLTYSSMIGNAPLMTDSEALLLRDELMVLHNHFKKIFDPANKNPNFAIDVEFKVHEIGGKRTLFIKQARPYIGKN